MGRIHVLCIFQHSVGSFLWQGSAFPGPSGWIAGLKSRTTCSSGAKDTSRLRAQTPRNWPKETHLNNPRQLSSQTSFFLPSGEVLIRSAGPWERAASTIIGFLIFIYCLRSSTQSHSTSVLHSSLRSEVSDRIFR
jgi:hypothetical protein